MTQECRNVVILTKSYHKFDLRFFENRAPGLGQISQKGWIPDLLEIEAKLGTTLIFDRFFKTFLFSEYLLSQHTAGFPGNDALNKFIFYLLTYLKCAQSHTLTGLSECVR